MKKKKKKKRITEVANGVKERRGANVKEESKRNVKSWYLIRKKGKRPFVLKCMVCKVEFNQPSCWLYSVPNLLVF